MSETWNPSYAQLEQIAAAETGRDYARERRETAETMRLCDELEDLDHERAADHVDEALAGWKNPLSGLPIPGFESPRYRTKEEQEYMDWILSDSPHAARTRAIVHPKTEDRLERGQPLHHDSAAHGVHSLLETR